MNEEIALQIITQLSNLAQKNGLLTIEDAVSVKQMLDFVNQKLTIKEEVNKPAK